MSRRMRKREIKQVKETDWNSQRTLKNENYWKSLKLKKIGKEIKELDPTTLKMKKRELYKKSFKKSDRQWSFMKIKNM